MKHLTVNNIIRNYVLLVLCSFVCTVAGFAAENLDWKRLGGPQSIVATNSIAVSCDLRYVMAVGQSVSWYLSSDSGKSFAFHSLKLAEDIIEVAQFGRQDFVAITDRGRVIIYRTADSATVFYNIPKEFTPTSISSDINSMVYVTTAEGSVLMSSDSCRNWLSQELAKVHLRKITCGKGDLCVCVGDSDFVAFTTNRGLSWDKSTKQVGLHKHALHVVSIISDSSWIVAGDTSFIMVTFDKATTWHRIVLDTAVTQSTYFPIGIEFCDALHGAIIGWNNLLPSAFIYSTSDGGKTWVSGNNVLPDPNDVLMTVSDFAFVGTGTTGFMSGFPAKVSSFRLIFDTTNYRYERRELITTTIPKADVIPVRYAKASDSTMWYMYVDVNRTLVNGSYRELCHADELDLNGTVVKSWYSQVLYDQAYTESYKIINIQKVDNDVAYALTDSAAMNSSYLLKRVLVTVDGGLSWRSITPVQKADIAALHCVNTKTVYAITYSGTIFKTTNAGLSWNTFESGFAYNSVRIVDATEQHFLSWCNDKDSKLCFLSYKNGEAQVFSTSIKGARLFSKSRTELYAVAKDSTCLIVYDTTNQFSINTLRIGSTPLYNAVKWCYFKSSIWATLSDYTIVCSEDSGRTIDTVRGHPMLEYMLKHPHGEQSLDLFVVGESLFSGYKSGTLLRGFTKDSTASAVLRSVNVMRNPLYPNPCASIVHVNVGPLVSQQKEAYDISLFNALGEKVASSLPFVIHGMNEEHQQLSVDLSTYPEGLYLMVLAYNAASFGHLVSIVR